jgi:hypothetical protein
MCLIVAETLFLPPHMDSWFSSGLDPIWHLARAYG